GWLNVHHARNEILPPRLREALLARLRAAPALAGLDPALLIDDKDAYEVFVREQWGTFVRRAAGTSIAKTGAPYILRFERDTELQDDLAGLLRTGAIAPVRVGSPDLLPAWARPGVLAETDDSRAARAVALAASLAGRLDDGGERRWDDWRAIAREWAELSILRVEMDSGSAAIAGIAPLEATLDRAFLDWLRRRYASLGGQKLPQPHHVHHVPLWLARERQETASRRVALIVIDGMSLADWRVIGPAWRRRHPGWKLDEHLVLAQVPTLTAISRQALVSGRRPEQFAGSIATNAREPHLWRQFWLEEGLQDGAIASARLNLDAADLPALPPAQVRALYWVTNAIDDIVHGATLGARDVVASLRLWLDHQSPLLESAIGDLLGAGFTVAIASDLGHVEARGTGTRTEGLAVETRGTRARVYRDRLLARKAHEALPGTVLWGEDGLLPNDMWVVMPVGRTAFAPPDDTVVTHGGPTIDEVIVPLVSIRMDT
nr:BREX-3 system phosphatase PglZ [Chloroflexia bacterium]